MNHTEKSLWKIFSKFIRFRDADERGYCHCISCNKIDNWKKLDAGHYIPKGSDMALKFNEINVNAQCSSCNVYKSGNIIEYRIGLIKKYGEKIVKKLELSHQFKTTHKKLNQLEINELWKYYSKKVKELEKIKSYD